MGCVSLEEIKIILARFPGGSCSKFNAKRWTASRQADTERWLEYKSFGVE
jgi:hypothetical protein